MTQDTRKDRRVKIVSLNVRYKSATVDEFIENHAHDVSRGGIYIKTANPFPPGTLLKFEIRLASDQAVIAGVGRVVWKRDAGSSNGDRPAGMGVKFIKIDEPSKSVIDRLVNTKADAGSAYESENEAPTVAVEVPQKVVVPAVTAKLSPPAGTPMAAAPRKATMMGLGTIPSSPPAGPSGSTPTPSATATSSAPDAPRASAAANMFPSTQGIEDMPPKQEQTVMKQAAELLEEALREAGGSMDEIGHNPLFSGTPAPIEVKSASAPPPPMAHERETVPHKTGGDSRPPGAEVKRASGSSVEVKTPGVDTGGAKAKEADEAAKARAMVAGMSPAPRRPASVPPATTRESPTAKGAPVAAAAAQKKGGGGGAFILLFVLVAGAAGAAVLYRDKLFGTGDTTPTTSATATSTATASAATSAAASATAPTESAAASASAGPATSASAAPSANAAASASAAPSAAAAPTGRPVPTATQAPTATGAPPKPADTIPGWPPATAAPTQTAAPTATAPRPTATATAAPTAAATATEAPKPKPKPKPADDNPY